MSDQNPEMSDHFWACKDILSWHLELLAWALGKIFKDGTSDSRREYKKYK